MPATSTLAGLPTGSQDTQQMNKTTICQTMVKLWASDDSELAQWEVLERIEADEGDNYIDPFYGGEDDDASVLNDNNNAPAANIPANKQRQLLENFRTYSDHAQQHFIPFTNHQRSCIKLMTTLHNKGLS
jgi:hypothetical protein